MKRYQVVLASVAEDDLAALVEHAQATAGAQVAAALLARLDRALGSLERHPIRGRVVPELRVRGIVVHHELVVAPYRIVYRTAGDEGWVLAVVDGRRDLDAMLFERARR